MDSGWMNGPVKFLSVTLLLILLMAILDGLFGLVLFHSVENRSGWDSFRWFNFEYHLRDLYRNRDGDDPRPYVLVVGSSISKYSVQKELWEKLYRNQYGREIRVEMAVHAAMIPEDLYHYMPRLQSLKPDLIVYITNPADYDLERYTPPYEAGPAYSLEASFQYRKNRYPARIYYPVAFAREFAGTPYSTSPESLDPEEEIALYSRGLLNALRYKGLYYDWFVFQFRARKGSITKYLNYQGLPVAGPLWKDGVSGGCFAFPVSHLRGRPEMKLQVMAGLPVENRFHADFYLLRDESSLKVSGKGSMLNDRDSSFAPSLVNCDPPEDHPSWTFVPRKTGWQKVKLPFLQKADLESKTAVVYIRLSHVLSDGGPVAVTEDASPFEGRGFRLTGDFGRERVPENDLMVRRRSLSDVMADSLNEREYAELYKTTTEPDDWDTKQKKYLWQMNSLRLSKYWINWVDFSSEIPQFRYLNRILEERDNSFLIINNPENPLASGIYLNSDWHRGYLSHLQSYEDRFPERIKTKDFLEFSKMNYFSDPHHLTYDAMVRMGPHYVEAIHEALEKGKGLHP